MKVLAAGIALSLVLLAQTLGVCQVTAQIEWSDVYTADKLPDETGWGASKGANTSSEITPEGLHIRDSGTANTELHCYSRRWPAQPDRGSVAEATVKAVSCTARSGMCLMVADGVHEDALTLYPDRIELNNSALKYAMDTTDAFHTYQVRICGLNIEVWVDGKLVIDGWNKFQAPAYAKRCVVQFGSISSASTGEAYWKEVRYSVNVLSAEQIAGAKNVTIYYKEGIYACFPSLIRAADGTLVTGFGTRVRRSHIDGTGGSARYLSKDGGYTWEPTTETFIDPARVREDGAIISPHAQGWIYVPDTELEKVKASGRRWMKAREGTIAYLGEPRVSITMPGKPAETRDLPNPDIRGVMTFNSSAFLHRGKLWMTAIYGGPTGQPMGVWVIRSEDDGNTWEVLPVALPADKKLGYGEAAICDNGRGEILCVMRPDPESYDTYQCFSKDDGKTWSTPEDCGFWGYPSNVILLKDGRLLCSYGYRRDAMGVRAVLSSDGGHTWDVDKEIVIRCDGKGSPSDLGYPISLQMEDGHIFTIYYLNDAANVTHIAGTHWDLPPATK